MVVGGEPDVGMGKQLLLTEQQYLQQCGWVYLVCIHTIIHSALQVVQCIVCTGSQHDCRYLQQLKGFSAATLIQDYLTACSLSTAASVIQTSCCLQLSANRHHAVGCLSVPLLQLYQVLYI